MVCFEPVGLRVSDPAEFRPEQSFRIARREVPILMASQEKKQPVERSDSSKSELARRFRANPFIFIGTVVILLITIVAFVFVPAMAPKAGGSGKLNFGSYGGEPIDFIPGNYFASQRDYYNQQLRASGQDANIQFAAFQVWRAAFESAVIRTAVLAEMKDAGFLVSEEKVDKAMAEHPAFLEEGRFSAAKYRAMTDAERMTLRNNLKDELIVSEYTDDLLSLHVPSKEKEFMKAMASPERSFEFVAFPLSSYPNSEVSAFIASNSALFKTVRLSVITLTGKEAEAKKIYESVKSGKTTFEEAVKAHSKDAFVDKNGDMGPRYAFELKTAVSDDAAREKVLGLEKGALSDLIKAGDGWAFYRCEEKAQESVAADPAVIEKAKEYLAAFERGKMEDWLISKANSFVQAASSGNFAGTASAFGVPLKKFGPVSLNYGDIEIYRSIAAFKLPELSGASTNEAFLKAAFSTKPASVANPVVVGDNVVVLRVSEEKAADDSSTAVIDFYYPYIVGQYSDRQIKDHFLGSKKLQDRFYETFVKYFLPQ